MDETKEPSGRSSDVIRASEIGEYVYCHRAWWLHRVRGAENANRAALDAGLVRHRAHGAQVRRAIWLQRVALLCVLLALVIGIVFLTTVLK